MRGDRSTESITVGSLAFIDKVKSELGFKADHRDVIESYGSYVLREPDNIPYGRRSVYSIVKCRWPFTREVHKGNVLNRLYTVTIGTLLATQL